MSYFFYINGEINNYSREEVMNSFNHISCQVDTLLEKGCRRLSNQEKEHFFKTTTSKLKPYYIKGLNKGKEREIYEVNGQCFNKVWQLISPYVFVACSKSTYGNFIEREEVMSEVKYECFRTLQLYGPKYNNQSFSQRLKIIVNNVLTNEFRKKSRRINSQYLDDTVEDFDRSNIIAVEDERYYLSEVPSNLKTAIEMLLSGMYLSEVKKVLKRDDLEVELLQFVHTSR